MGVMDDPVEDGVDDGWLTDHVVPLRDGQLSGDERGLSPVAFLEDFQQNKALLIVEGCGCPNRRGPAIGRGRACRRDAGSGHRGEPWRDFRIGAAAPANRARNDRAAPPDGRLVLKGALALSSAAGLLRKAISCSSGSCRYRQDSRPESPRFEPAACSLRSQVFLPKLEQFPGQTG